ncbi:hypothetical protein I79_005476 [Cricetulus griseus]|uniref:Uncharacterized protein n=1 Tax=Cricetulus griseus TaxID=10029 RepID=G3H598_CRIGR|nr:hypothetical protein I79_005476 [Cricetulus griseus]ERE80440.1 hypothetical protein H671_3g8847 [Cricetulus griseus]
MEHKIHSPQSVTKQNPASLTSGQQCCFLKPRVCRLGCKVAVASEHGIFECLDVTLIPEQTVWTQKMIQGLGIVAHRLRQQARAHACSQLRLISVMAE